MPYLPEIPQGNGQVINTTQFLGLNRGLSIADGEMADMLNMSSDNYPVLSTRSPRGVPAFDYNAVVEPVFTGQIDGMLGTDRLVVCHDGKVYIDGIEVPITLSTEPNKREKKLVSMGAYVCIWPDKKYFNINEPDDCGDMGLKWEAAEDADISATMCRLDGTDYDMTQIVVSDIAPTDPRDRDFWIDTGGEKHVLKQYSQMYNQWVQVATTYIKIQTPGIGKGIKDGDVVWLSGVKEPSNEGDDELQDTYGTVTVSGKNVTLSDGVTRTLKEDTVADFDTVYRTEEVPSNTQTIVINNLPEKSKITSAVVKFRLAAQLYNWTEWTCNGITLNGGTGEQSVPVSVSADNKVMLKFRYRVGRPPGFVNEWTGSYDNTINITNVKVEASYAQTHYVGNNTEELERLNTTNRIYGAGDDYIIVAGLLHQAVKLEDTLGVEMKVPDLDYVCESNNRIWGCCYSEADGKIVNELRACALGDYRNWYKFIGTSTDSYTMSLGSDGVFTGAFSLQGVPIFFKESFIHRISGTVPANFTLNTIRGRGVQEGSWKSLAVVNERLYYKGKTEIMAYEGALPYSVSERLGQTYYQKAVAGACRDKYYINMQDRATKAWHTYVLDTVKGLWHQEDKSQISHMTTIGGELVMACQENDATILRTVGTRTGSTEGAFDWGVTFGTFGYQQEQQKYLSRFNIRAQIEAGGWMKVEMQYDSDGKWHHMGTMKSPKLRTYLLPIIPRRCDHCQLRISGRGNVNIYSIARIYENGGDG